MEKLSVSLCSVQCYLLEICLTTQHFMSTMYVNYFGEQVCFKILQ